MITIALPQLPGSRDKRSAPADAVVLASADDKSFA